MASSSASPSLMPHNFVIPQTKQVPIIPLENPEFETLNHSDFPKHITGPPVGSVPYNRITLSTFSDPHLLVHYLCQPELLSWGVIKKADGKLAVQFVTNVVTPTVIAKPQYQRRKKAVLGLGGMGATTETSHVLNQII